MSFWTVEEFKQFIDCVMDKRQPYMAFMVLNWTGIRLGELLALTAADVDFEKRTISITKSYQCLGKERCYHTTRDIKNQESNYNSGVFGSGY